MICIRCVTPIPLKKLVADNGTLCKCNYCDEDNVAVDAKFLFDYVIERVEENIASEGDLSSYEEVSIYDIGADDISVATIDVVLSEWFDLGDDPYFDDLLKHLPNKYLKNSRGYDRHYYADDGLLERNFYEDRWAKFIDGIRHSHRFFNPNARDFLDSVFSFLSTDRGELKSEVVRTLKQGQELYRARTVQDYDAAKKIEEDPVSQLGPTPRDRATSQRMTPNGISALYCALERETCLSEIRSITGDHVLIVAMTPTTQLKLLDLTKLERIEPPKLTVHEKGYLEAMHLKTFISSLVKKMSRPKGRNDELGYLSTQVVFEYLRLSFGNQVEGLVFPSVQTGEKGMNVVLFPESSVISTSRYEKPDEIKHTLGSDTDAALDRFKPEEKLAVVANSMRYYQVLAIQTTAEEFSHIGELFMGDLARKRIGLR